MSIINIEIGNHKSGRLLKWFFSTHSNREAECVFVFIFLIYVQVQW